MIFRFTVAKYGLGKNERFVFEPHPVEVVPRYHMHMPTKRHRDLISFDLRVIALNTCGYEKFVHFSRKIKSGKS